MHDIEPHYKWRDNYIASDDDKTPFFGKIYDEFSFSQKIYNYFIHPQWDDFGSPTLYTKILFADYDDGFVICEMIGEWNDCINNDIMFFKREVVDVLVEHGINKFIIICENVLNFHAGEDDYYEEWVSDIVEDGGWISFINTLQHVEEEMASSNLNYYVNFGEYMSSINWRPLKPKQILILIEKIIQSNTKQLRY
jgi:hypothetical protein